MALKSRSSSFSMHYGVIRGPGALTRAFIPLVRSRAESRYCLVSSRTYFEFSTTTIDSEVYLRLTTSNDT